MKKALVLGAIVAVLGIGGLGVALMMGADTSDKATETTSKKKNKKTTTTSTENGVTVSEDGTVSMGGGSGAEKGEPDAEKATSTPRPLNAAEIAQEARMKRPFNQHVYNVSAWWGQATRLTLTSDPALATEIQDLATAMREGTRQDDANLDVTALLDREDALLQKLKASSSNAEIQAIVKYIGDSLAVTRAGGDPNTVVRPEITFTK